MSDQFPEHRERAIGLFSSITPIGGIVGPNLGGWIVSQFSWRYIFYINLPIGIVLIVMIMILLRESKVLSRSHIDFVGASFFFGAILFLMLGLNLVAEDFALSSLLLRLSPCHDVVVIADSAINVQNSEIRIVEPARR